MMTFFRQKLYPDEVINKAYNRVKLITRDEALQSTNKKTDRKLPLVVTYGKQGIQNASAIRMIYRQTIRQDPQLSDIFPETITAAYRRPRNLRDMLVRAQLPQQHRSCINPGTTPCNVKKCLTCKHVLQTSSISGPKGNQRINSNFTCQSECVIYAITCTKCSMTYIGETKRLLRTRFREHLYNLTHGEKSAVSNHFTLVHTREDMRVTAIQHAPKDEKHRKQLEAKIIFKLGTLTPNGLNTDFQFL